MKTELTAKNFDSLTSYIGNRWNKKGDRLYLTDDFMLAAIGLEYESYKTGNICRATLNGEKVSNTKAGKILSFLRFAKIHIDLETGELMNAGEYAEAIAAAVNAALPSVDLSDKKNLEVLIHRSYAFKSWTEWASMIDDVPGDEVWTQPAVYCDMLEKLDLSAVPVEQARQLPTAAAYSLFFALSYLKKVYRASRARGRFCFGMDDEMYIEDVTDPYGIGILEQLGYDLEVREYGTDDLRELLRRRGWKHLFASIFYTSSKDQSVSSVFRPGVQLDSPEVWNIFKCIPADFFTENQAVDYGFAAPDLSFGGAVSVSERPCGDPLRGKVELIGLCGVTFCIVLDEKRAEKAVFMVQNGKKHLPAGTLFELIKKYL